MSTGSEMPNSVKKFLGGAHVIRPNPSGFRRCRSRPGAGTLRGTVEIAFIFDLAVACCDRHFVRPIGMVSDRGHDLLFPGYVEGEDITGPTVFIWRIRRRASSNRARFGAAVAAAPAFE